MTDSERVQRLIEKGHEVLRTHQPNPPGVIGFPTLDSGAFSAWQAQCLNFLESKLPPTSPYSHSFREKVAKGYTGSVKSGIGILESLKEDIEAGQIGPDETGPNPVQLIGTICERFHLIARQLRSRHDNRATIDVQDEYDARICSTGSCTFISMTSALRSGPPSYAGKCSRIDFLLKQEQIVIEIKKTRAGLGAKEVGSQLIEDIARYESHPDCQTLVCFVYDPDGRISNPRGIENDLRKSDSNPRVEVLIRP
jgi:DpnII restriction endonuclease